MDKISLAQKLVRADDDGFSDEGSCYWLGKKALELFSKESDGRVKKGKLLEIFRYNFNLKNDFDLIDIFDEVYKNNRTKTAELQKLLLQAAMQGDEEAIRLYEAAAEELALIIGAVYRKLEFRETRSYLIQVDCFMQEILY